MCVQVITQQSGIITTLTLSLVWIVYSIIPQYLLLHYTWVGRGTTLRYACQIGFYISSLCAFCAIILLWLVYPKTVSLLVPPDVELERLSQRLTVSVNSMPRGL